VTMLGTLRSRLSRRDDLSTRLAALETAVDAARGRLDPALIRDADETLTRAHGRIRLSPEHTIVALAGATGSGKSSLFNRLCGLELAAVGVRRPTTSWTLACSWGPGAGDVLDWLGVPARHQVDRASALDVVAPEPDLQGLVLLDLPDHDSTEVSHHLEVERLVRLADVLVWVLDPQKYADAAVHERFLRPLASHRDVMIAVFNHIDELGSIAAAEAVADARRLLAADGLGALRLIATSATRGDGVSELRSELAKRVEQKRSSHVRVSADIDNVARRLMSATGSGEPTALSGKQRAELVDACAGAAGVPVVVAAVEEALRMRASQATGWPPTRWLSRLRPDPLRRLHLRPGMTLGTGSDVPVARSSLPSPTPVQRARVGTAVRRTADVVGASLPPAWETSLRAASVARLAGVTDALDKAVATVQLADERAPRWWSWVRALQWLLLLGAVLGACWLAALAGISYLGLPPPGDPTWLSLPVPTWLLLGGLLLGFALAATSRAVGRASARRRARRADVRLRSSVADVVDELVLGPIQVEIDAYLTCRRGLAQALKR
jgi:GTP-binding protein EngB required for normal cell division